MAKGKRIHLLDEIRGVAIICMVFFHAFYTMTYLFDMALGRALLNFFAPASPWFAGLFVLISGISCRLSRSNAKRGAKLLAIALALSLVTWALERYAGFQGLSIRFGILHLLAVCMLLYALIGRGTDRLPFLLALPLWTALFLVTRPLSDGYLWLFGYRAALPEAVVNCPWLFPIGIVAPGFASADYYPLLPWMCLFFLGANLGKWFAEGKLPAFFYNQHIRPVAFCGRNTLWIYLAHQPVIYGILWVVTQIVK